MLNPREMIVIQKFRKEGGILKMSQALKKGVNRWELYKLRDKGELIPIARGLYKLKNTPISSDFVLIAEKIPHGIICLTSALDYYGLTTRLSFQIHVAVPSNVSKYRFAYPPVRYFWFSKKSLISGVKKIKISKKEVKIFDREKTLIDCLRYQKKLGMDLFVEALKTYLSSENTNMKKLFKYAVDFKLEKKLRSILEILTTD